MPIGVAHLRAVLNEEERIIDYEYVDVNRVYEYGLWRESCRQTHQRYFP